jgi:hypothetical protein
MEPHAAALDRLVLIEECKKGFGVVHENNDRGKRVILTWMHRKHFHCACPFR